MKGDVSISVKHPIQETDKAWLFETYDKDHPYWIAKSQCQLICQTRGRTLQNILIVAGWLDQRDNLSIRLKSPTKTDKVLRLSKGNKNTLLWIFEEARNMQATYVDKRRTKGIKRIDTLEKKLFGITKETIQPCSDSQTAHLTSDKSHQPASD